MEMRLSLTFCQDENYRMSSDVCSSLVGVVEGYVTVGVLSNVTGHCDEFVRGEVDEEPVVGTAEGRDVEWMLLILGAGYWI